MARYIDADLIQYTKQYYSTTLHGEYTLNTSKNHIDAIPTADVTEIKYGRWIGVTPMVDTIECSVCGHQELSEEFATPYCPECGAKMNEEIRD